MKNVTLRKILITLFILMSLCSICVVANSFTTSKKVVAETTTIGSLAPGDSIEQVNYCTMFGNSVAVTHTLTNASDPGNGVNYALNGANAVKFNVKLNSENIWNHYFAIFNNSSDAYYSNNLYFMLAVGGNANRGKKFAFYGESTEPNYHYLPSGIDYSSTDASYTIEYGGLEILDINTNHKGTYYYLIINDIIVYEYYKYGDTKPTGTYFNMAANSTKVVYSGLYKATVVGELNGDYSLETPSVRTTLNGEMSVNNILADSSNPGNGVNYALNGANTVKLNVKLNSSNIWNQYFVLFTESSSGSYSTSGKRFDFYVSSANPNRGMFAFSGENNGNNKYQLPAVDFENAGADYDIEFGGLEILDVNNIHKGMYYYFKINDVYAYQFYSYGEEKPTGEYFNLAGNCADIIYTSLAPIEEKYTVRTIVDGVESSKEVIKGETFVLPTVALENKVFVGWVNDNNLYCEGKEIEVNGDITYTAKFVQFIMEQGAQVRASGKPALRFIFRIATDDRNDLSHLVSSLSFGAKITSLDMSGYMINDDIKNWYAIEKDYSGIAFDVYTITLTNFNIGDKDYSNYRFVPNGIMKLQYADGTEKTVSASGKTFSRSIAEACLIAASDYKLVAGGEYTVLYNGKYYRESLTTEMLDYITNKANEYQPSVSSASRDMFAYYGPSNGMYALHTGLGDKAGTAMNGTDTPTDFRTKERYQEYKDAGFNIVLLENECSYLPTAEVGWADSKLKEVMDICYEIGLKVIVFDIRIYADCQNTGGIIGKSSYTGFNVESEDKLDELIWFYTKDYSKHPAFYGVYLIDEPSSDYYMSVGQIYKSIKKNCPSAYVYFSLAGGNALSQEAKDLYITYGITSVAVDMYPFLYRNNLDYSDQYLNDGYISTLKKISDMSKELDIDFTAIFLQSFSGQYNGVYGYSPLTETMLKYQASIVSTFAPEKMVYFHYWASPYYTLDDYKGLNYSSFIDKDGNKLIYDEAKAVNEDLLAFTKAMYGFEYQGSNVYHSLSELPYYYGDFTSDFVYANNVVCSNPHGEVIVAELKNSTENGQFEYGYVVTNSTYINQPDFNDDVSISIDFGNASKVIIVSNNGNKSIVDLTNGEFSFTLKACENIFVLPIFD